MDETNDKPHPLGETRTDRIMNVVVTLAVFAFAIGIGVALFIEEPKTKKPCRDESCIYYRMSACEKLEIAKEVCKLGNDFACDKLWNLNLKCNYKLEEE